MHTNIRYVDALVERLESLGTNILLAFCNPATDEEGQENAEWIVRNWFSDDDGPVADAITSSFMFSLSMSEQGRDVDDERSAAEDVFLTELGVPALQAITTMRSRSRYRLSGTGVMDFELALLVALSELDGNIITHPISGKERMEDEVGVGSAPKQHFLIEDRVDHVACLVVNWVRLRHLPNDRKNIAVVLHNHPPSDDGIGAVFGMDSLENTVNLLSELRERGYAVGDLPVDGQAFIDDLTSQLTLDDRRVAPEDVRDSSVDMVAPDQHADWFADADDRFRDDVVREWGDPPERPSAIPGVEFGNVLATVQPPHGFGMDPSKVYHDPDPQPPHDYVALYVWPRESSEADAVVHLDTRGSLEWLPGETIGLNGESTPDQLISDFPNVYPYIINNPGEGTQVKRRSYAVIVDYLTPVMHTAGTYDDLADLEKLAREYRGAGTGEVRLERDNQLRELLVDAVDDLDLAVELGFDDAEATRGADGDVGFDEAEIEFNELVERVHEHLTDVKTTQIRTSLYTTGEPFVNDRLVECLVALTRLPNADTPSLHENVAGVMGVDCDRIRDEPGAYDDDLGVYLSEAANRVYDQCVKLVSVLAERDFDVLESEVDTGPDDGVNMNLLVIDIDQLGDARTKRGAYDNLHEVLAFICDEAASRAAVAENEIPQAADVLNGEYVRPGGSGAPTHGGVGLLPTGRNFYTLDPRRVPAKSAWSVDERVAEGVLNRHYDDHGEYPEEFGVAVWGTPTVRTRGETITQVLVFMGVEPVWTDVGRADDVEPIPLGDLDRPRIDMATRVSGLFRNAFPQAASVVNDAVDAVVDSDEPHEMNYVKKHVGENATEFELEGVDLDEAETLAKHRVLTTMPGGYGVGTNKVVDEGEWDDRSDLAGMFVQWGGYVLESRDKVTKAHDAFECRLNGVGAIVEIEDTAEQDEFDSSGWYAFHGGFVSAVDEIPGSDPALYVGDSSDPNNVSVRINGEKVRKAMRACVPNPDWLDSMEEYGYRGVSGLSTTVNVVLGWDATTDVVSDTLWERPADAYAPDKGRQEWLHDVNPQALGSITATFLEIIGRDLWDADDDVRERPQDINPSVEGDLEANTTNAVT